MEETHWYALATSYCRELKLRSYLDTRGLETYIPMKYEFREKNGRRERVLKPAIHNLIFVRSDRATLRSIKLVTTGSDSSFRWIMDTIKKEPIVISDRQMQSFVKVCDSRLDGISYFNNKDVSYFTKGDKVRVASGPFEGIEGYLTRIHKDRCVVVVIDGLAAVATTFVHPSMLEKIKEE